jgi:hypothetical protein
MKLATTASAPTGKYFPASERTSYDMDRLRLRNPPSVVNWST